MINKLPTIRTQSHNHCTSLNSSIHQGKETFNSVHEASLFKQSPKNSNSVHSLKSNRHTTRVKTYQDVSYLEAKSYTPTKLSLIAKDPQAYQQFNKTKSNFFVTMHRHGANHDLQDSLTDLKGISTQIDFKPLLSDPRVTDFKTYIKNLTLHQSKEIQESRVPSNRLQILQLKEWFEKMSDKIKSDSVMSAVQISEQLQTLLSVCLKEIIRQVSIECNERGDLLEQVWNFYVELIEHVLKNYLAMHEQQNKTSSQIYKNELSEYQLIIDQMESKYYEITKEMETLTTTNQQLLSTIQSQQHQFIAMNNEIRNLNEQLCLSQQNLEQAVADLNNFRAESEISLYPKRTQISMDRGQSIVSHLLSQRNSIIHQVRANIATTSRLEINSRDVIRKQSIVSLSQFPNNLPTIPNWPQFNTHLIVDEAETQTDPIEYSDIPALNQLIKCLINGFVDHETTEYHNKLFTTSINIIDTQSNIAQEEKEELKVTFNRVKLLLATFSTLHRQLTDLDTNNKELTEQQQALNKQNQQYMLDLKEKENNVHELEELLKDTAYEYMDVLKRKRQKIINLKKTNTHIAHQLSSITSVKLIDELSIKKPPYALETINRQASQFSKTPSFKKKLDVSEELIMRQEVSFEAQKEGEESGQSDDDDDDSNCSINNMQKNWKSKELPMISINPLCNSVNVTHNSNQSNNMVNSTTTPPKLNIVMRRYGIMNSSLKKSITRPLPISSSLLQKLKKDKRVRRIYSQNTDAANNLLKDIVQSNATKLKESWITLSQVQKIMTKIMLEAGKSQDGFKIPLNIGIYDFFIKKYGFKQVAEKKIKQVLLFVYHKRQNDDKLELLARLCQMDGHMDDIVYKLVIESQKYFQSKDVQFNKATVNISQEQVIDYCNDLLERFLGNSYIQTLYEQLKSIQVVTFHNLMLKIMNLYVLKKEACQSSLKVIFQAADLDGNNLMQYHEFKNLYQAIHPKLYNKQIVLSQYLSYADFVEEDSSDRVITLSRFTEMAMELNLFTKELIEAYAAGYQNLVDAWEKERDNIKCRYIKAKKFGQAKFIHSELNEQIGCLKNGQNCQNDIQTLWISYRLLLENSRKVILSYETKECMRLMLPQALQQLNYTCKILDDI